MNNPDKNQAYMLMETINGVIVSSEGFGETPWWIGWDGWRDSRLRGRLVLKVEVEKTKGCENV